MKRIVNNYHYEPDAWMADYPDKQVGEYLQLFKEKAVRSAANALLFSMAERYGEPSRRDFLLWKSTPKRALKKEVSKEVSES